MSEQIMTRRRRNRKYRIVYTYPSRWTNGKAHVEYYDPDAMLPFRNRKGGWVLVCTQQDANHCHHDLEGAPDLCKKCLPIFVDVFPDLIE